MSRDVYENRGRTHDRVEFDEEPYEKLWGMTGYVIRRGPTTQGHTTTILFLDGSWSVYSTEAGGWSVTKRHRRGQPLSESEVNARRRKVEREEGTRK